MLPPWVAMHENQDRTLARVARVLEERLRPAVHSHPHSLELAAYRVNGEPIPVAEGLAAGYRPARVGDAWGRAWDTTWFKVTGEVPATFAGYRVELLVDLGFDVDLTGFQAEGLVYRADGSPVRSLHPQAQWIPVSPEAAGGEPIEFYIEAGSNPVLLEPDWSFRPTEKGEWDTAGDELLYRLRRADVVIFEPEVFELVHDVEVLLQLAEQLDPCSARRAKILVALDRALDVIDLQNVAGTAAAGRAPLAPLLASPAAPSAHRIIAVGHAHIDSAWLWPLRETVRKVARTTSSMVTLIDEHDEFVYAMSSAQQYAWLKQHRPEVYRRVKQAVADGRFVPVGGMWVEADAVLPGGESMIRQFLYGATVLSRRVRCRVPRGVAAGQLRLLGGAAAAADRRRFRLVPDPEAFVERAQHVSAQHVRVGGHRRLANLHSLSPGRHLQRTALGRGARPGRAQLQGEGDRVVVAGADRLR